MDTMTPGGLHTQIKGTLGDAGRDRAKDRSRGSSGGPLHEFKKYGANVVPWLITSLPDPAEYGPVLEQWSNVVRLWMLAPEMEPSGAFVDAASAKGIIIAAGHTEAGADLLGTLVSRGLRVATHWSNATGVPPPRFRGTRSPGTDEFSLCCATRSWRRSFPIPVAASVTPIMLQLLYRVKGLGPHHADLRRVLELGRRGRPWRGAEAGDSSADVFFTKEGDLCGSKLCMAEAASREFQETHGLRASWKFPRMGPINQAKLFGWSDDLGSLEVGKVANLVLTDDDLAIQGVWLEGQPVS